MKVTTLETLTNALTELFCEHSCLNAEEAPYRYVKQKIRELIIEEIVKEKK